MKKQTLRSRSDAELLAYHQKWYDELMKAAEDIEGSGGQRDNYYRNEAMRIMKEGIEPLKKKLRAKESGQKDKEQKET